MCLNCHCIITDQSNQQDLTNVLGVDKEQLYRDFMRLQQEMVSSEDTPLPPQSEDIHQQSHDSDYY